MAGDTPEQGEGRIVNGRYRLLRTLGAGGMGRVWLAYDEELACEVAIKEISLPDVPRDASEPAHRIARARSEARHAARLRGHPHVATVHDVVIHEGLPWIVMEYVPDGVDLQAVVRRSGPLPPAQVARIGLAVLDALTAGHRIGILHRDVKPANILLAPNASGDPYARVLLTDYGIALQPESREPRLTATAGILGTPGYLAPERARGEPPTPAADLFSLGATLYAAVEGRGPFDRHGDYATLTALLGEEPTPAVRAGELAPVLQGLLVKDPVLRSTPETAAHGLERVALSAGPVPGHTPMPEGFGPAPGGWSTPERPPGNADFGPAGNSDFGPPGHVPGGPQGRIQGGHPGQLQGGPPGYAVGGGPYGPPTPGGGGPGATHQSPAPYGDRPAAALGGFTPAGRPTPGTPNTPGVPQTPGAPPTPNTPNTPNTPGGAASPYAPQGQAGSGGSYGQWNPYANSPTMSYQGAYPGARQEPYQGGAVPPPYAGGQGPTYPGGPGHAAGPPGGGPRRRKPVAAVVALVVAVALVIAGGVWAVTTLTGGKDTAATKKASPSASSSVSSPTGSEYPYGQEVGLKKALQTGDCVHVVWTGTAFRSRPNLGVVSCAHDVPDGQVMAVDTASDFADARDHGAERCAGKAKAAADSLADADVYALTPTQAGFGAAGGGTACLVLGRHVPIGGEIGRFRDTGANVWTTEMSVGDCWLYVDHKTYFTATLTDCADEHTDQVIGFVTAPKTMAFEEALQQGNKLCGNKFESTWAPGTDRSVYGYLSDENNWKAGFNSVVCTVGQADHSRTTGAISSSGTAA
ncbi:serine/threonine-protein kinase [Streptomyces sp. STR69]|uniref:serine/threonine-protein kinase n=1 Tax=Streptomyces sp. STR69 TaxID=1796942 RepID=UPI0021C57D06|nr:serine/threonine-protein kinase [Streptomyces sp. STR69]